uniref:Uncharacterized protein n=1 Tax=Trichobilharzia regenti TaxID=157069 RepID=A0AA85K8Y7_TRIRE|nr:unnamed protein product [Trichobilharzia regenti]
MCGSSSRHTPCSTRSKRRKYKKSIIETVSRGVRQRKSNNEKQNSFIEDHKSQGVDASALATENDFEPCHQLFPTIDIYRPEDPSLEVYTFLRGLDQLLWISLTGAKFLFDRR